MGRAWVLGSNRVYSMGLLFRGLVLRSKRGGNIAGLASMKVVQDAGHCGARHFREFGGPSSDFASPIDHGFGE
jgi:hypothetical protein